jgi:protocatechuate 3,4-dioxygenase beta subunit
LTIELMIDDRAIDDWNRRGQCPPAGTFSVIRCFQSLILNPQSSILNQSSMARSQIVNTGARHMPLPFRRAVCAAVATLILGVSARSDPGVAAQGIPSSASVQAPPATALILGRVIDAATNRPMPGVVVRIGAGGAGAAATSTAEPTAAMTTAHGEFLFRDLQAGAYGLAAQASGYMPGAYGERRPEGTSDVVNVEAGARVTDVTIRMWKYAAINGTVLDDSGEPVVNALVRLLQRGTVRGQRQLLPMLRNSARTDDRGVYRMGSLPPGEYTVVVTSTRTTAPPAEGMDAVRAAAMAEVGLVRIGSVTGARIGNWQVSSSDTGLGVGGATSPDPDANGRLLVHPTVFHPAAVRPSEAAIVTLRAGDDVNGIDVRLPLVPSLRISGTITSPGPISPQFELQLVTADQGLALASGYDTATAVPAPDGRFAFLGVPAGQYIIRAVQTPPAVQAPPAERPQSATMQVGNTFTSLGFGLTPPPTASGDPTLWAEVPVTLGDEPVDNVAVVLRPGARLIGRLEFDESAPRPLPEVLQRLYLLFNTVSGLPAGLTLGRVNAQGQFHTAEYPAGRYFVDVGPPVLGPSWMLESIMMDGRDVVDVPFDLGTEDIRDIVVRYTTQVGTISGSARRQVSTSSTSDLGAVVVLFPADLERRLATGTRDRSQIRDVHANGTFRLTGLRPGDYLVAAVDAAVLPLDMQRAETVAALARIATRVTLGRGDSRTVTLTVGDIR